MSNVAVTYSDLGRHADALKLQKNSLAFFKSVLPGRSPRYLHMHAKPRSCIL